MYIEVELSYYEVQILERYLKQKAYAHTMTPQLFIQNKVNVMVNKIVRQMRNEND